MRKITETVVTAFLARQPKTLDNTTSSGETLFLHGNRIAWHGSHNGAAGIFMTLAGWDTPTTRERLNGILSIMGHKQDRGCLGFIQRKGEQFLGSHTYGDYKLPAEKREIGMVEVVFIVNPCTAVGLAAVTFAIQPWTPEVAR